MVNSDSHSIDITSLLNTIYDNKFKIIFLSLLGIALGIYLGFKNQNHSHEYGIYLYGLPETKYDTFIDFAEQIEEIKKVNFKSSSTLLSDFKYDDYFIQRIGNSKDRSSIILDLVINDLYFSEVIEKTHDEVKLFNDDIDKQLIVKKIKSNLKIFVPESNLKLRPQAMLTLRTKQKNDQAIIFIDTLLKNVNAVSIANIQKQYNNMIEKVEEKNQYNLDFINFRKENNSLNNKDLIDYLINFLNMHRDFAKNNSISSDERITMGKPMNQGIVSFDEDKFSNYLLFFQIIDKLQNLNYYLKGYELIDKEIEFLLQNKESILKWNNTRNIDLDTDLKLLNLQKNEIENLKTSQDLKKISKLFNYDISQLIITTSRNLFLAYVISSFLIFFVFSIFLSILLNKNNK